MVEESYGLQDYSDPQPVTSVDPVCGRAINEKEAAGHVGFAGQMYYFCSQDCLDAFQEKPAKYAGRQR